MVKLLWVFSQSITLQGKYYMLYRNPVKHIFLPQLPTIQEAHTINPAIIDT
jgi:hypothetical protein